MKKQSSEERLVAWLAAPCRPLSVDETLATRRRWQARYIDAVAAPDKPRRPRRCARVARASRQASPRLRRGLHEAGIEMTFATLQDAIRARGPLLLDVYFASNDLTWSLAFTHEMRMGLGPYLVTAPA